MRINVYTEELLRGEEGGLPVAEIVSTEYISSRTGEQMKNYGLRIFLASAPELHYIPGRDDDRSAVTFWCGPKKDDVYSWLKHVESWAVQSGIDQWREKVGTAAAEAEEIIDAQGSRFNDPVDRDAN